MEQERMKPFVDFETWVEKKWSQGIDGTDKPEKYYVPYALLKEYWTKDKIIEVLHSHAGKSHNVRFEEIRRRFLRIFSILVYATDDVAFRIRHIHHFISSNIDDNNLPLEGPDSRVFPSGEEGVTAWEAFDKHQFLFNPISLGEDFPHNRCLVPRCILPWKPGPVLTKRKNNRTIVQKYTVNDTSRLHKRGDTIAVKKMQLRNRKDVPDDEAEFTNEVVAYMALENCPERDTASKYFLKYYGSFKQNGWGYVLLEYADEGSLEEFYAKNNTPHTPSEVHDLWDAMLNPLRGLAILHYLDEKITRTLRGVHQDLKPSNIFVFKVRDDTRDNHASYKYCFKIGDFGLSSIRLHENLHPDNQGTAMYGAPELFSSIPDFQHHDVGATHLVDIWSLGCIYFEMLVWITCGQRGRDEFCSMRESEGGPEAAFHKHGKKLDALQAMLELVLSRQRVFDNLTRKIAYRIWKSMLCLSRPDRMDAKTLIGEFVDVLEWSKGGGNNAAIPEPHGISLGLHNQSLDHVQGPPVQGPSLQPPPPQLRTGPYGSRVSGSPDELSAGNPRQSVAAPVLQNALKIEIPDSQDTGRARQAPPVIARGESTRQKTKPLRYRGHSPATGSQPQPIHNNSWVLMNGTQPATQPSLDDRAHRLTLSDPTAMNYPQQPAYLEPPRPFSADAGLTTGPMRQPPGIQMRVESRPGAHSRSPISPYEQSNTNRHSRYDTQIPAKDPREAVHRENPPATPGGQQWPQKPRVSDILKYKGMKKAKELPEDFKLPGLEDALKYQAGREQIFVHDDSRSMYKHKAEVIQMVEALSYIVKTCDRNGVEFIPISQPKNPIKDKPDSTSKILKHLKGLQEATGQNDNIEYNFGVILDAVKGMKVDTGRLGSLRSLASRSQTEAKQPDVSIYVLTDGIWGRDYGEGWPAIAAPIRDLIRELRYNRRRRTSIMIQFIQFGNDPDGTRRLRYLDNNLAMEPEMYDYPPLALRLLTSDIAQ
ncbi:kinase-like domain-containing protein [Triangularia verruculosa]|uniref:non-specific serine/threonine protein kinase n=1 Tax=Triangularia verruculosa TaxID=2587418 RepID=A0AAN6XMM0_9PEZI|nr:kinase-like domain-containing protein [Triangularia verruculosa]